MVGMQRIRVADAAPIARKVGVSKKRTPPFLYAIPLLPVLFVILISGKGPPEADLTSFEPPQVRKEEYLRQHQAQLTAATISSVVPVTKKEQEIVSVGQSSKHDVSKELHLLKQGDLITSPSTIVTAYFTLKSKFAKESYIKWMSNMLSAQDAMVIFTSPEMVETMQSLRSHAQNRTVIIPFDLSQMELVQKYDEQFWAQQLDKDPEKRIHHSYQLFWIWLSKSFFVTTAIDLDIFKSDLFMWSDIGCYRNSRYNNKEVILQIPLIPRDRILQMAHHEPKPPPYIWWNDKYSQSGYFYHSGSQMIGYKTTWLQFHREFTTTVEGFVQRGMFIGEDQTVLQSTCLRVPSLCAYVPSTQVSDNHYFGLRFVLHFGGTFQYWYPPDGLPAERSDVSDKSLLEPSKAERPGRKKFKAA